MTMSCKDLICKELQARLPSPPLDSYAPAVYITFAEGHREGTDEPGCGPGVGHVHNLVNSLRNAEIECLSCKFRRSS